MRTVRLLVLMLVALAAVACRPDTVDLTYNFNEGDTQTFDLTATAMASWDIGGEGEGSYTISFLVTESVLSASADEATIDVTMSPVNVTEEGLPSPGPEDRSFTMRVGQNGRVREVLQVDGLAAESLDPSDVAFIGLYRPPLPLDRVRLGDRWVTEQDLSLGGITQEITSVGRLDRFSVVGGSKTADISYEVSGPIEWTTQLPQGAAELTGTSETTARAELDIGNGQLRSAHSATRGDFEVLVLPREGQGPVEGTLRLDLELKLASI
ncbi:MAG: hypothetical protein ACR2KQ_06110 [Actinomycetota bacterium]